MVFASYSYIIFLVIAVVIYWLIPVKFKNIFLLFASYIFYCFSDIQLIALLIATTLYNYYFSKYLIRYKSKINLAIGIIINLLPLFYYKYIYFVLENVVWLLPSFQGSLNIHKYILPLGISFFTFQAISYQIDVYGGFTGYRRLLDFAIYIAMWPKLLAGPIVRPEELSEQISKEKFLTHVDYKEGYQRILQGLFKKIVIADNLAPIVAQIFLPSQISLGWIDCCLGTVAFGLQIYFDFSGYSDIAIGSARLLGYRLPENFDYPYKAVSFSDFWSKWHITLSSWIRDYIFLPLAMKFGKRKSSIYMVTIFSMIVMGFWHGANWTFAVWGLWHGILLFFQNTIGKTLFFRPKGGKKIAAIITTFLAVHVGWLFFRAESVRHIVKMMKNIFTLKGGLRPILLQGNDISLILFYSIGLSVWMIVYPFYKDYIKNNPEILHRTAWLKTIYNVIILFTILLMERNTQSFIYFNF